jgi:hypothetical protein
MPFYEKGDVRIRYEETGSGFPDIRQAVAPEERNDQFATSPRRGACRCDYSAIWLVPKRCQPTLDFVDIVRIDYAQLDPGRKRGCGLYRSELSNVGCESGIAQDRNARRLRRELPEQLKPLAAYAVFERDESSCVAPRPCHATDDAPPTGSVALTKTIGTLRVTFWRATTA